MQGLSIGRLAKLAHVTTDTIRFYEKAGLLSPNVRRPSGFRQYSDIDVRQLRFIRRGRQLGFSLEEIGGLLALEPATAAASDVLAQQLQLTDRKIEELTRWRRGLLQLTETDPATSASIVDCFPELAAGSDMSDEVIRDCDDQS